MFAKKTVSATSTGREYRKKLEFLYARRTAVDALFQRLDQGIDGRAPRVQKLELFSVFSASAGGRDCLLREHSTNVPERLLNYKWLPGPESTLKWVSVLPP